MAYVYASLSEALKGENLTQQQLAGAVTALRVKRPSGGRLKLSQNFVSQLCSGQRNAGTLLAKAISRALKNKIDPAVLVFGSSRSAA